MRLGALVALVWLAGGCGLLVDFGSEGSDSPDAGPGTGTLDGGAPDGRATRDAAGPSDGRDEGSARDASVDGGDSGPVFGSCKELLEAGMTEDREYVITVGGVPITVYCDMTNGGWTRVVLVSPAEGCIDELPLRAGEGVCAPPPPPVGCDNSDDPRTTRLVLSVPLDSYSQIRGTARGRQYGTADAFAFGGTIDQEYVDGVSITVGSPREHVWTYAVGLFDNAGITDHQICPCGDGRGTPAPAFVGTSYHCDSGNEYPFSLLCEWHAPTLWSDGGTCGPRSDPWFEVAVGSRSDPIEVRVMASQDDEDIGIELLELYAM